MNFTIWNGRHAMKTRRFTEAQIAFARKQAELSTKVEGVCRKLGISEATFYNQRMKAAPGAAARWRAPVAQAAGGGPEPG
jgi:hypothetical protein